MSKIKRLLGQMTLNQKRYAIIMLICVMINLILAEVATRANMPLWLDVPGTIAATIILEPAAGLIVGLINNFFQAIFINGPTTLVYYSVSAAAALLAALMLDESGRLKLGRIIVSALLIIIVSTLLSALLKHWQSGGVSDNFWENYFSILAVSKGAGAFLSSCIGTLLVKIPDTIVSVFLAVVMYKITPEKYRGRDKCQLL